MEESRLKPMVAGYDEEMFNRLFRKTENLRKKLASEIDPNRFGVCYCDIVSFFNTKFIYVFNKYYGHTEGVLLGHLIKALQLFKFRILRSAYILKHNHKKVDIDSLVTYEENLVDNADPYKEKNNYLPVLMDFLKNHLSENAYLLLEVQLNPPPFILSKINPGADSSLQKIPDHVYLEYLNLGSSENSYKYLKFLKNEIKDATNYAKANKESLIASLSKLPSSMVE